MKSFALAMFLAAGLAGAALAGPAPTGKWLTASGNVEIEIAPCGEALCGAIVRVLANRSMSDPSRAMGAAPGVGTQILTDLKPAGEGRWIGKLYNRENGKTYDCIVTLPAPGRMEVRGYVGVPALGQSQIWTRVD
jgi:uncharacterized protein (DUF2147 family)